MLQYLDQQVVCVDIEFSTGKNCALSQSGVAIKLAGAVNSQVIKAACEKIDERKTFNVYVDICIQIQKSEYLDALVVPGDERRKGQLAINVALFEDFLLVIDIQGVQL